MSADPSLSDDVPVWSAEYPDPVRLRLEVAAAAETFIAALWNVAKPEDIAGIYVKGSGLKHWDSPLDYVPVLSDVDVHVLFADDDVVDRFDTVPVALRLSETAERRFREAVSEPIHVPRVQLVLANRLFSQPDFVPSPPETVETRFGIPYPTNAVRPPLSRQFAVARTREHQPYLSGLAHTVADLTGPHLRRVLRDLSWRVAPTGPRVLELRGVDFHTCWSSNRTGITRLLVATGEPDLAGAYRNFYLSGWQYFLSHDADGDAARAAIEAGYEVLIRAVQVAESQAS